MNNIVKLWGLAVAGAVSLPAQALDVSPADYAWQPDGTKLLVLYGQHTTASTLRLDGAGEVSRSQSDVTVGMIRGVTYKQIGGLKTAWQFILPVGNIASSRIGGVDQPVSDGVGDLILGFTAYALESSEPDGTTLAVTLYLNAPTGAHDVDRVSLGKGTWTATPQVGIIKGLGNGFFVEGTLDVAFTRSKEHEGIKVSHDESTQFQGYLRYQFDPAKALSLGYSGRWGGDQYSDGVYAGTRTRSDQIRLTGSAFLSPSSQLQVMLGRDVKVDGGFKTDLVGQLRYLKVF